VQEAQEALRIVQHHNKHVAEAHANFQRQAHRLNEALTSGELPKATALLRRSISILESYVSLQAPASGRSGSSGTASTSIASASSDGFGLASLQQMIFAPFTDSALRAAASLFAAAVITFSSFASPTVPNPDFGPEPAGQAVAEATSPLAQPAREAAGKINEIVSDIWDAEQKKAESEAEIQSIFQRGQDGAIPPEKP
jgi:hypothetical protein